MNLSILGRNKDLPNGMTIVGTKLLLPVCSLTEAVINAINAAEDMKTLTAIFNREYKNFETAVMKEQFTKCCTARKLELQAMKGKDNANS